MKDFLQNRLLLVVFIITIFSLLQLYQRHRINERTQEVYKIQWYSEYGVPLPDGVDPEECFMYPEYCL